MCREVIEGEAVTNNDALYHPACFTCSKCYQPCGARFREIRGQRVCPDCAPRQQCKACQKEIDHGSPVFTFEGVDYHPSCARCEKESCSGMLGDGAGRVRGLLVCKSCKSPAAPKKKPKVESSDPVCKGCGKVIDGEYVFGDPEDAFHEKCFVCAGCSCALEGEFAVDEGDQKRYLCASCFRAANPDVDLQDEMETSPDRQTSTEVVAAAPDALSSSASTGERKASDEMETAASSSSTEVDATAPDSLPSTAPTREKKGGLRKEAPSVKTKSVHFSGEDDTIRYNPWREAADRREDDLGNGDRMSFETDRQMQSLQGERCSDRCTHSCAVQ